MTDVSQAENISGIIKLFKMEQEKLILKSLNDSRFKLKTKAATEPVKLDVAVSNDTSLSKLVNADCVIMPVSQSSEKYQILWPQALLANFSKCIVELGTIEAHGSLWRLIQRKDAYPGYRVIFQAVVRIIFDFLPYQTGNRRNPYVSWANA